MKRPVSRLLFVSFLGLTILVVIQTIHARSNDGEDWSLAQKIAIQSVIKAQQRLAAIRAEEISESTHANLNAAGVLENALVGVEWSHLVSTQGSLDAKIASTDPRWAAVFVSWYEQAGAGPDRPIAIGSSASFPALLLSARIAAEVLGAEPIIVGSLSASNYGATIPEFDLWRMEETLLESWIINTPMRALTPGGHHDRLAGFDIPEREATLSRLKDIAKLSQAPQVIFPNNIKESIQLREEVLLSDEPAIFVNIGGHSANYGTGAAALTLPHGYIEPTWLSGVSPAGDSVTFRALKRGIPVANVLNIRSIMLQEGLEPLAPGGTPRLFPPLKPYSWPLRLVSFISFIFLVWFLRLPKKGN